MARYGLRPFFLLIALSTLYACTTKQVESSSSQSRHHSFLYSRLPQETLYRQAQNFLLEEAGYQISYQDPGRGILVTRWREGPEAGYRHRLSLGIHADEEGSVLSLNRELQAGDSPPGGVLELPDTEQQQEILKAFEDYIQEP